MRGLACALMAAVVGLGLAGCGESTLTPAVTPTVAPDAAPTLLAPVPTVAPTAAPSPTAVPTPTPVPVAATAVPEPTVTATPSPTAVPTPTPVPEATAAVPEPTVTATPSPTPLPTPTPVPEADFDVAASEATLMLPDSITFHLQGTGGRPIETIDVEFGTNHVFSCASSSYWSARTDFEMDEEVSVSWNWDMRRTGSMPPGALIWWRRRVVDDMGQEYRTARQETGFTDDRFDWQSHTDGHITYYWYAGGEDFGQRLADGARDGLDTLQLGQELVAPIKAFVYESADDVQGAVLFAQAWTGGLAFVRHNILLIAVNPDNFDRQLPGVVHELAHLLVEEVTFNCFGGLPTWLDEGLAVYAEGGLPEFQEIALGNAIANDELISLRSLNSSFPAADTGATLSYAQSYSLVNYLIETRGWDKMQELLEVFSQGSTDEKAIREVYGWDYDTLESLWHSSLGLQ